MKRTLFIFRRTLLWTLALSSCAAGAGAAQCAAGQQIHALLKDALRDHVSSGVRIPEAGELNCPSVLTGAEPLRVASLRSDRLLHSLAARLECAPAGCLPFVVHLPVPEDARASLENKLVMNRSKPRPAVMTKQYSVSARQSLVRPGQLVTLLWEAGPMRITRAMVCLDLGEKDQWVRTRPREGGRTVRGRVLSAGMVRAEP